MNHQRIHTGTWVDLNLDLCVEGGVLQGKSLTFVMNVRNDFVSGLGYWCIGEFIRMNDRTSVIGVRLHLDIR